MNVSKALLTLACAGVTCSASALALVTNGSFELDTPNLNYWLITSNLIGWTGAPEIELRNNYDGVAQDGVNFVELDTFANSSMSQTITGTGLVELSFWYSPRPNVIAGSNDISFSLGDLSGVLLNGVAGGPAHNWQQYVGIADIGTSGSATLTFSALGISDQSGGSLDNISVRPVPEPGVIAMSLLGAGVVGSLSRRRKTHRVG